MGVGGNVGVGVGNGVSVGVGVKVGVGVGVGVFVGVGVGVGDGVGDGVGVGVGGGMYWRGAVIPWSIIPDSSSGPDDARQRNDAAEYLGGKLLSLDTLS